MELAQERGEAHPALLVMVVVVLVVGLSLLVNAGDDDREPTGFGASSLPGAETGCAEDPQLVASRVEEVRGLSFERVPTIECLPPEELRKRVRELIEEAGEDDELSPIERRRVRAEGEASLVTLKLAGLLPPDFDESANAVASVGLETAGVYVPESGTVLISPGPESERYLAHELVHALDDQNFGVDREASRSSEADAGYQALVEGSATFHEVLYAQRFLDSGIDPRDAIRARSLLEAPSGSPPLLQYLLFPYLAGGQFVATLVEEGGSATVDEAYKDPPTSTGEILHPEEWFEREDFEPIAASEAGRMLGARWERIGAGEAGEVDAILTLEQGGSSELARVAAKGIKGGRYEAWKLPGDCKQPCRDRRVAIISYRFEGERDAVQFKVAAEEYIREGLGADRAVVASDARTGLGSVSTEGFPLADGAVAVGRGTRSGSIAFAPGARLAAELATRAAIAADARD